MRQAELDAAYGRGRVHDLAEAGLDRKGTRGERGVLLGRFADESIIDALRNVHTFTVDDAVRVVEFARGDRDVQREGLRVMLGDVDEQGQYSTPGSITEARRVMQRFLEVKRAQEDAGWEQGGLGLGFGESLMDTEYRIAYQSGSRKKANSVCALGRSRKKLPPIIGRSEATFNLPAAAHELTSGKEASVPPMSSVVSDIQSEFPEIVKTENSGKANLSLAEAKATGMFKEGKMVAGNAVIVEPGANFSIDDAQHASPHEFEEFDLKHIGSGEGAQAYGWGLYFSENWGVNRSYHSNFTRKVRVDGKKVKEHPMNYLVDLEVEDGELMGWDERNGVEGADPDMGRLSYKVTELGGITFGNAGVMQSRLAPVGDFYTDRKLFQIRDAAVRFARSLAIPRSGGCKKTLK